MDFKWEKVGVRRRVLSRIYEAKYSRIDQVKFAKDSL